MAGERPRLTLLTFNGRPFAGKDFQGKRFQERYQHVGVISPGKLLRDQELLSHTFSPEKIEAINTDRNNGKNIDLDTMKKLMYSKILDEFQNGNSTIILTGYPRTLTQQRDLREWRQALQSEGIETDSIYVHFRISPWNANKRREKRALEEGRADDQNKSTARRRHREFERNVLPMIFMARLRRTPVFSIKAEKKPDEVTAQLESVLVPYLPPRKF